MEHLTPIIPGHFSLTYNIGEFNQADNASVKIESEIPLTIKDNDPFNVITVKEKRNGLNYSYHAFLTEPYLKLPVQEAGSIGKDKFTYIKISSENEWSKITSNMRTRFEKVLSQPLPKEYVPLIQEVQKSNSLEDKVNQLLVHMTQKYNYLGDWRTVSGGFTPRSLDEIASTKFGDCKDFSVMTVKLLREMKITADVALVMRGPATIIRLMAYDIPGMDLFNHAIVRIEDKGKVYWIDPTNKLSFGLNQRSDISGRPALPLTTKNKLEDIPLNSSE
jgi:transglutaminase-like putative cysteine protease